MLSQAVEGLASLSFREAKVSTSWFIGIGQKKLPLASGITTSNIRQYAPFVDHMLLSSSIETKAYSGLFVPERIKEIVEIAADC